MNAQRFTDRSIVVTGGASGIGQATAIAFAREGGRVTIADLDEARGAAVAEEIRAAGGTAQFVRIDATDEGQVADLIARAGAAHGPVRHAFNNVGLSRHGSIETMTREDWDWTIGVSLTSSWLAMKYEVPVMLANGGGTIVNTASMSGKIYTAAASPAYSAAKAGVVQLSHYASAAYAARGIRVNSVSPGLTATPVVAGMLSEEEQRAIAGELQAIARAVDPAEIAATVLFLSSDEAAMITGRDIEVSGGRRV
jgi:NAD(P)-dependent dehydrogenase (short-subunit alcohol dehydrogenase family)